MRNNYEVVIAGGGPAGASAAIHLAEQGVSVLLVEQKKFPREKLCGEFISPECRRHFERLGVADVIAAAGPSALNKTIFYSRRGKSVTVPSSWFGGGTALGLSRAVMDNALLQRAKQVGVEVLEDATVTGVLEDGGCIRGVRIRVDGREFDQTALVTVEATGRARTLSKKLSAPRARRQTRLVAFKAHFENTHVAPGVCEIYVYPGGYGGLSTIEGSISNLCFIVSSEVVRRAHSDPQMLVRETVQQNRRAADALKDATLSSTWLSVALETFGRFDPSPLPGLLTIGDAASFIDPFTGSGMLMALESGELVAEGFVRQRDKSAVINLEALSKEYVFDYRRNFNSRFKISGVLRRAAFNPFLAEAAIVLTRGSRRLRNQLARATRPRRRFSNAG